MSEDRGHAARQDDDTPKQQPLTDPKDVALAFASIGFGPELTVGGLFSTRLTYCLTCGAVVPIPPAVEGQEHPLDLHLRFHEEQTR